MIVPNRKHAYGPPRPVTGIAFLFLYVNVGTLQETHVRASADCYGDSFTFYKSMNFVSHRKYVRASKACYGYNFTFPTLLLKPIQTWPAMYVARNFKPSLTNAWSMVPVPKKQQAVFQPRRSPVLPSGFPVIILAVSLKWRRHVIDGLSTRCFIHTTADYVRGCSCFIFILTYLCPILLI
jgi:hypothetical protein